MRYIVLFFVVISLLCNPNAVFAEVTETAVVLSRKKLLNTLSDELLEKSNPIGLTKEQFDSFNKIISNVKSNLAILDEKIKAIDGEINVMSVEASYAVEATNMLAAEKKHFLDMKKVTIDNVLKLIKSTLTPDQSKKLNVLINKKGDT